MTETLLTFLSIPMSIRVLLYEDNATLRDAMSFLVENSDGFELAGAFEDCTRAETQVRLLKPDVVLMDIEMPGMDGISGLVRIKSIYPRVNVLMLTVFDDDDRVFKAIQSGATGYLLKKTPSEKILESIKEVFRGGAPMTPVIARKVLRHLHKPLRDKNNFALTEREKQVIDQLAQGLSYKMVAAKLDISLETIRTHAKRIYEKLQVHSVTQAIAKLKG